MTKNTIHMNLEDSVYAHGFENENQVHRYDIDRALKLIQQQLDGCEGDNEKSDGDSIILNHPYNTIGVFGDRGSGKTSFLVSLLEKCRREKGNQLEVLKIIDPTLVEHKKPMILCVIAAINQLITEYFQNKECVVGSRTFDEKRCWEKRVRDLSVGVFAVDGIGKDYSDSLWQDEDYVMYTGLRKVNQANNFEKSIRLLVDEALKILNKKAFLLAFDDVDMDLEQGWSVIETLRRYLSYPRIITIVSGNLKLYGMLVRHKLTDNLKINSCDSSASKEISNELENQYMLKILSPANRIYLMTISNILQDNSTEIIVSRGDSTNSKIAIGKAYKEILIGLGIKDDTTIRTYSHFLESMSLRSQIHFLKEAWVDEKNILPLSVFSSRMYSARIDVEWLKQSPQYTNIEILKYLASNGIFTEAYLLQPTLPDKDDNSVLMGFTILSSKYREPQYLFDYMLRIGYLRNVALDGLDDVNNLCKYAQWQQYVSLKANIGLSMAYMIGKKLGNLKEHIQMFRLENKSKKPVNNALDAELNKELDGKVRLLAMFPFVNLLYSKKNESENYYSLFVLLGVISEILGCESVEEMSEKIKDLKDFTSYTIPSDGDTLSLDSGEKEQIAIEISQEAVNWLAEKMFQWKQEYIDSGITMPVYLIGRFMTRLYNATINISEGSVGDRMSRMVGNLFNATLLEETRLTNVSIEVSLNHNNLRDDNSVLIANLDKISKKDSNWRAIPFTRWIMGCPMLNCFLDDELLRIVKRSVRTISDDDSNNVYTMLKAINSKKPIASKQNFSGRTENYKNTLSILRDRISDDDIITNIILPSTPSAVEYLKSLQIFHIVNSNSVEAFRKNWEKDHK
jgi:hypothetical protein